MMKHLIENDKIVRSGIPKTFHSSTLKGVTIGYDTLPDQIHYDDGWRDELTPEINPELQQLGDRYYDIENDRVTYHKVDRPLPALEELKAWKIEEFEPILNEFTTLIQRAKIVSGDSAELDEVIATIRGVKDQTITAINASDDVLQLMKFSFRPEDIDALKDMLKPFLL